MMNSQAAAAALPQYGLDSMNRRLLVLLFIARISDRVVACTLRRLSNMLSADALAGRVR